MTFQVKSFYVVRKNTFIRVIERNTWSAVVIYTKYIRIFRYVVVTNKASNAVAALCGTDKWTVSGNFIPSL